MRLAPSLDELSRKYNLYAEQDKKDFLRLRRILFGYAVFSFSVLTLSFVFTLWVLWR